MISLIAGLGVVILTAVLAYTRQILRDNSSSTRPKTAEPYGEYLRFLNERENGDKVQTEWLNMGYWEDTVDFSEACEALALKLVKASKCVPGGRVLDVGHATGESLLLHLTHPKVPRPSCLFGITSLKSQHERAVERVSNISYQPTEVRLYLGDAVFHPLLSSSSPPPSSIQITHHPLEPNTGNRATPAHPTYTSIIALDCAYHFRTRERFLKQSFQCLSPGGGIALADICVDSSMAGSKISALRRLYGALFSIPRENLVTIDEYKHIMEQAGYQNVVIQDISSFVFPRFTEFLKSRGVGYWVFGWMIQVWWKNCGAKFVIASGERREDTSK